MLEAPSLGAHGADLPISYTHELAADPNNGDTSSRAHEATPTQWESNESFAIGHLLGSDTDQEVQNLEVALRNAISEAELPPPPLIESPRQPRDDHSTQNELLIKSNAPSSSSSPSSHRAPVDPHLLQPRTVDFSSPPVLTFAPSTLPSSFSHPTPISRASSSSTNHKPDNTRFNIPESEPPSPSWSRFNTTTKQIRDEISSTYLHPHENPDREFVAAGTAETLLDGKRLTALFVDDLGTQRTKDLIFVVEALELQSIILVLVQIRCDRSNLQDFEEYYVKSGNKTPRQLPFTRQEACGIFGNECGNLFFRTQSCYTPVIIDEGGHTIVGNSMRVPLICAGELGKGACGTVFKALVPMGVWRSSSGSTNVADKIIATKVFDDKDLFDAEVAMYKAIEKDTTHKNLTKYLGSLQYDTGQGTKYVIFLPLALWNLDTLLTNPKLDPATDHGTGINHILRYAANILRDAAGLVGGLKHLHQALDNEKGQNISILHGDFKPQNILVFNDDTRTRRYIWKLADYGLSKTKSREPGRDDTSSPARNGTFISPEAYSGRKITIVNDLWGLAAVLIVVVTHIVDGPEGKDSLVKRFETTRKVEEPDDCHDRFFIGTGDNACVNPNVTNWCKELRAAATEKDKTFGQIISDVLTFLENNLLVLDVDKRSKTQAGRVREVLFEMADKLEKHAHESGVFALQITQANVAHTEQQVFPQNGHILSPVPLENPSSDTSQATTTVSVRMKTRVRQLARRIFRKHKRSPRT